MASTKTHLVQSREIATTCVCPYLFKLTYPFGVVGGERNYLVANTVHDIMSLVTPTIILDNWQQGAMTKIEFESIVRTMSRDSDSIVETTIANTKDKAKKEGNALATIETFDSDVRDRFHGLLVGLTKRIMKKYQQPKRAVTEITITNVNKVHEGRIDALFEFHDGTYGLIDWKTNDINKTSGSSTDKWQLMANLLLANYRYTGDEDNWSKCLFGSVVYYEGAYIPRFPSNGDTITKVKNDRRYAHEILCGGRPHAQKPAFCPVCDKQNEGSHDCQFYREDSRQASEGSLPPDYAKIRSLLVARRYVVLDERGETYKHKFVINAIIDKLGENAALEELEKTGVIHSGYHLQSICDNSVSLVKTDNKDSITLLEPRKVVRIIGREEQRGELSIPLLASINEKGFVKEVDNEKLIIDLDGKTASQRTLNQLANFSLIIIPDEINLTRRVLEPMHRFHKLAAETMLPAFFVGNEKNNEPQF